MLSIFVKSEFWRRGSGRGSGAVQARFRTPTEPTEAGLSEA